LKLTELSYQLLRTGLDNLLAMKTYSK